MTPGDTSRVLAKAAAFDQRTVGHSDVMAWHEILADLDVIDALAAVSRHYATADQRIMPVHVRRLALDIARDRKRELREAAERRALEAEVSAAVTVEDRSAGVNRLIDELRERWGPSDPTVLRRREWVRDERKRDRAQDDTAPNPRYQGPPPPGGWPLPDA